MTTIEKIETDRNFVADTYKVITDCKTIWELFRDLEQFLDRFEVVEMEVFKGGYSNFLTSGIYYYGTCKRSISYQIADTAISRIHAYAIDHQLHVMVYI